MANDGVASRRPTAARRSHAPIATSNRGRSLTRTRLAGVVKEVELAVEVPGRDQGDQGLDGRSCRPKPPGFCVPTRPRDLGIRQVPILRCQDPGVSDLRGTQMADRACPHTAGGIAASLRRSGVSSATSHSESLPSVTSASQITVSAASSASGARGGTPWCCRAPRPASRPLSGAEDR